MTHSITYNTKDKIIETIIQGELFENEAEEIIAGIVQLAVEKSCFLCFTDYREANLQLSTIQLHKIPERISEAAYALNIHPAKFKRAVVVKKSKDGYRFFETVTLNSGQNIKMFDNVEKAKEWLLGN